MTAETEKTSWPQIPGVDFHLARTGEKPPHAWVGPPADMVSHGGYGVIADDGQYGPYCWAENAEIEAGRHPGGRVVLWRYVEKRRAAG